MKFTMGSTCSPKRVSECSMYVKAIVISSLYMYVLDTGVCVCVCVGVGVGAGGCGCGCVTNSVFATSDKTPPDMHT